MSGVPCEEYCLLILGVCKSYLCLSVPCEELAVGVGLAEALALVDGGGGEGGGLHEEHVV